MKKLIMVLGCFFIGLMTLSAQEKTNGSVLKYKPFFLLQANNINIKHFGLGIEKPIAHNMSIEIKAGYSWDRSTLIKSQITYLQGGPRLYLNLKEEKKESIFQNGLFLQPEFLFLSMNIEFLENELFILPENSFNAMAIGFMANAGYKHSIQELCTIEMMGGIGSLAGEQFFYAIDVLLGINIGRKNRN